MQPSLGEVVADELQAFCLLLLDIKIVKNNKKKWVYLFIYLFYCTYAHFFVLQNGTKKSWDFMRTHDR